MDATFMIVWLGLTTAPLSETPPAYKEDLLREGSAPAREDLELPSSRRDPDVAWERDLLEGEAR